MTEEQFNNALWEIGAFALGWVKPGETASEDAQRILHWLHMAECPRIAKVLPIKQIYREYRDFTASAGREPLTFEEWLPQVNPGVYGGFLVFGKGRPKYDGLIISVFDKHERKLDS